MVVHRNLVLVQAATANAAYDRALELGFEANDSDTNPEGRATTFEFLGIGDLALVQNELQDGAELCFTETIVADKEAVRRAIPERGGVTVFRPRTESRIDYRSRDVLETMKKLSSSE